MNEQIITDFATWLEARGFNVAPEAPQWQAIRYYDAHAKAYGMYTDKRARLGEKFLNDESRDHWTAFYAEQVLALPGALKTTNALPSTLGGYTNIFTLELGHLLTRPSNAVLRQSLGDVAENLDDVRRALTDVLVDAAKLGYTVEIHTIPNAPPQMGANTVEVSLRPHLHVAREIETLLKGSK